MPHLRQKETQMNLDDTKKRVGEIDNDVARRRSDPLWCGSPHLTIDGDFLLTLARDLMEEVEGLTEKLVVGEAGGKLLKAIQEETEAEKARLIDERDVANSRAKFAEHSSSQAHAERRQALDHLRICQGQLSDLQAELKEAKRFLFDDSTVSALREELKAVKEENDRLTTEQENLIKELKKELYEFQKESVAVAARNMELSGQLATLQAAFAEANGKMMEVENAIGVLLRTHMHLTHENFPVIEMGAVQVDWDNERYAKAWMLLWNQYGPQKETTTAPVICGGCGHEINPDYGKCQRCG